MDDVAITVRGISKCYRLNHGASESWLASFGGAAAAGRGKEFWALRDVSFDLKRGERLGIIGRNGAGKSTLLKILARLVYPTQGEARIRGRVTPLLEVGTGMNELLTGRQNIYLLAALHGCTPDYTRSVMDETIDFSGLGGFIDEPVKTYSSGMRSRLGFSVAAHLDPDILLLDEVLAVGDMHFVQKCLRKVEGLTSGGRTVIFVSHSIADVVKFCDRGLWLEQGRVAMHGPVQAVAEAYTTSMLGLKAEARPEAKAAPVEVTAPAPADAPKDPEKPAADIVLFRLLDSEDRTKAAFLRQEPMRVQIRFRALRGDLPLITSVHVHQEGVHVFSTHPTETIQPVAGAVYEAVVEIPPLLLNRGVYQFSAAVVTPVRPILRHAQLELAISCTVFDQIADAEIFSGDYRGVVRPKLPWTVRRRETE